MAHLGQGTETRLPDLVSFKLIQMKNDEIEEVTDEMLEMLVKSHEHVAAIICKSGKLKYA